jgi:hypothetical protein
MAGQMILRTLLGTGIMAGVAVATLLALPSTPRDSAQRQEPPAPKGDRLESPHQTPGDDRREPWIPWAVPDLPPAPKPLPAPPQPVLERASTSTAGASAQANICTRHHGWKVMTDNGRSWHCAFR